MKTSCKPKLYVALTHYPVKNRRGEVIAAAVTTIDVHDIARTAKTYGVRAFYVVTPLRDQMILVRRIREHWLNGFGGRYNPQRRQALELVSIRESLSAVEAEIEQDCSDRPRWIATTAGRRPGMLSFATLRHHLRQGRPHLLVLGTAWGLADSLIEAADGVLEPVCGTSVYNHLSVRSAAAVILDRLMLAQT